MDADLQTGLTFAPNAIVRATSRLRRLAAGLAWSGLLCILFGLIFTVGQPTALAAATQGSTITFDTAVYTFNEGANSGVITLRIDPPSSTPITVTVSSSSIQATASEDFEGLRDSLVISPSVAAVTVSLLLIDDALIEGNEQLRLTMGNLQGATLGAITETIVTIEDNDLVYLGINDLVVDEESGRAQVIITQSTTSTLESVVNFHTMDGSATSSEDYVAKSGSAVIAPGETHTTIEIELQSDAQGELVENFFVQLEDPLNAVLANTTATVTILDDDLLPQLNLTGAEANERDGVLPFVITLSNSWSQTVTVAYSTMDGSAVAPGDYLPNTGVVTIPPGILSATVLVEVVHDQVDEPDETVLLLLADPVQAILEVTQVEGTIHNDAWRYNLFLPGTPK